MSNTVVRKTYLKILTTETQRKYLDHICNQVLFRAGQVVTEIVQKSCDVFDTRDGDKIDSFTNAVDEDFKELFNLTINAANSSRTIRDPFVNKKSKVGNKTEDKLALHCRKMLDNGKLPILSNSVESKLDHTAFKIAVGHLGSWHDCDNRTKKNYSTAANELDKLKDAVNDFSIKFEIDFISELNKWLESNKIHLSKKKLAKFDRFGWDTHRLPVDQLKEINEYKNYWQQTMQLKMAQQRLEDLRPRSALTLPGNKPRDIPLGDNAIAYSLKYENGCISTVSIKDMEFKVADTSYFKNLKIVTSNPSYKIYYNGKPVRTGQKSHFSTEDEARLWVEKQVIKPKSPHYGRDLRGYTYIKPDDIDKTSYDFSYIRGNKSNLPEDITAVLKETTLLKRGEEYYLGLCLNVQVPNLDDKTKAFVDYFYSEKADAKPLIGVNVMGIDLGITNLGYCTVASSTGKGNYDVKDSFLIGDIINKSFFNKMNNLLKKIKEVYKDINVLREKVPYGGIFGKENWQNFHSLPEWKECRDRVQSVINEFKEICRWEKRGIIGLKEQSMMIKLYKEFIGFLKSWTYLGSKPKEKGQRSVGFEKHQKHLENLKKDFRKKFACEVVRAARRHGVTIIAAEDLQHFKPDGERKSGDNERLMLWGKGEILKWLKHFAEQYGICVITVDPRMTSQTDPLTGLFAYRCYGSLYVEREGIIEELDADCAASENIAARVHHRQTNEPFLYVKSVGDGQYILEEPISDEKDGDEANKGKKMKSARLNKRFGRLPVLISNGKVSDEKPVGYPEGSSEILYLLGEEWVTRTKVHEYQNRIAARVKVLKGGVSEESQQPLVL